MSEDYKVQYLLSNKNDTVTIKVDSKYGDSILKFRKSHLSGISFSGPSSSDMSYGLMTINIQGNPHHISCNNKGDYTRLIKLLKF